MTFKEALLEMVDGKIALYRSTRCRWSRNRMEYCASDGSWGECGLKYPRDAQDGWSIEEPTCEVQLTLDSDEWKPTYAYTATRVEINGKQV